MSNKGARNAYHRAQNLPTIKEFCEDNDLKFEFIHGFEWHVRIEKVMDVFPTRKRWHWLKTGERGSYTDYDDLGCIFIEHVRATEQI